MLIKTSKNISYLKMTCAYNHQFQHQLELMGVQKENEDFVYVNSNSYERMYDTNVKIAVEEGYTALTTISSFKCPSKFPNMKGQSMRKSLNSKRICQKPCYTIK